jgi:hypothetical protein
VHDSSSTEKGKGSIMRISEIFAMGAMGAGYSDGQGDNRFGCESSRGRYAGCIPFDDPRYTRKGLAHILGSSHDGSGVLGILGARGYSGG